MREAQALEFDIVVIGAGLFGSACAKHLGLLTGGDKRICLIGPEEPHDRADSNVNSKHHVACCCRQDKGVFFRCLAAGMMREDSIIKARRVCGDILQGKLLTGAD